MSPSTPEESIFHAAIELSDANARVDYIRRACGSDRQLRQRVEGLVSAYGEGEFLESPIGDVAVTELLPPIGEKSGDTIGPYKLLEQIGEGGMGLVFMADQTKPLRRRVALKIIKPGLDTQAVIARFEAERQALALMDHPHIARVYDAGATESGRPFFVMELVRGAPITDYCRERQLNLRQRLELFIEVCQAVQHAHQKGVIHRDLKPTNILVAHDDTTPVPKVIDFGVAKATTQQLTERTLFTHFAQIIGTPLYMSPEQAEFNYLDVDTRSDVYSLGVVVYELLTGTTPFDAKRLRSVAPDEMRRIIREEEPPKPSTRATTVAVAMSTVDTKASTPSRIDGSALRGDLDWIVMKALDKDRRRRYESPSALAADVQRYLDDEPVEARSPSTAYVLRKFAQRNKAGIAIGGVILFTLLVAGIALGWTIHDRQSRQLLVEKEILLAIKEAHGAYQREDFSQASTAVKHAERLAATSPTITHVRNRIDQWIAGLAMVRDLEAAGLVSATMLSDGLNVATAAVDYEKAFRRAGLDLMQIESSANVALIRQSLIRKQLVAALDHWATICDIDRRSQLLSLARAVDEDPWRNRLRDAEDLDTLQALARDDASLTQAPSTIVLLADRLLRSDMKLALDLLRRAQRHHPDDFWINYLLGSNLIFERPGEAAGFLRVATKRRPDAAQPHNNLGHALLNLGNYSDAEAELREAVRLAPHVPHFHAKLAIALLRQDEFAKMEESLRAAIGLAPSNAALHFHLGSSLASQGQTTAAINSFRKALQLGLNDRPLFQELIVALHRAGALEEREQAVSDAAQVHPKVFGNPTSIALMYLDAGELEPAAEQYEREFAEHPEGFPAGVRAALLWLAAGERVAYERVCRAMLKRAPQSDDPHAARRTAWACLMSPEPVGDMQQLVALAERGLTATAYWYLAARERGLAAYRAGDWTGALNWCAQSRAAVDYHHIQGQNLLLEAMAFHRLGRVDEALAAYRESAPWMEGKLRDESGRFVTDGDVIDVVDYELLKQEADGLLQIESDGDGP